MPKWIRTLLFCGLAMGLAVTAGATEKAREDEPKTELEKFRHALSEISAHVTNAGAKLNHGAVSMGQDSKQAAPTPAQVCCGTNIETIGKRLTALAMSIQNLNVCYKTEENVDAQVNLNLVHQDAGSLQRALQNFRNARGRDVRLGYGAVVKGYLLLEQSGKKLAECPANP